MTHHNIPVPERGYWQRKESGQSPKQPPLSPAKHELLEKVEIYVKGDPKEWLTGDEIADFESRIEAEQSEERRVVVEGNVGRHPLIVATRRRRGAQSPRGIYECR